VGFFACQVFEYVNSTVFSHVGWDTFAKYPKIGAVVSAIKALPSAQAFKSVGTAPGHYHLAENVVAEYKAGAEAKTEAAAAPKLKLAYFPFPGRGEVIRWALTLGGIQFEDWRMGFEEFGRLSAGAEFAYSTIPVLYVGDQQIGQSSAALRYAGKLAGLYPKDDLIAAQCDAVIDSIKELDVRLEPSIFAEGDEKKKMREALIPQLKEYFNYYEHALARNKTGSGFYFEHLSIADLMSAAEANRYLDGNLDHVPTTILDEVFSANTDPAHSVFL